MRYSSFADNRALLQVLTHSENMLQSPEDIVKTAIAGGVVGFFLDEKKRFADPVVLPSSRDIFTLASLIAESFFAPYLRRVVGDTSSRYAIFTDSGCFEPLALPVILFPDCFFESSLPNASLRVVLSQLRSPNKGQNDDVTEETSFSSHTGVPVIETVDVLELHQLRSCVGLLLFKSVNEVLYDAEVCKLQSLKQTTTATSSEVPATSAVMALFYELKILLLCCVISAKDAYTLQDSSTESRRSARECFNKLFPIEELNSIFDHTSRRSASDVEKWYDDVLSKITGDLLMGDGDQLGVFSELQTRALLEARRTNRMPFRLLHRPQNGVGSTRLQLSFVHAELPHLAPQPGELAHLLFDSLGHSLVFDSDPSKLCFLLCRSATVKLTGAQLRAAELLLAELPWIKLRSSVVESVQHHLASDEFLTSMLDKNSFLVAKLVQWLRDGPSEQEGVVSLYDGETQQRVADGTSMANDIIERAIQNSSFGAAIAQFIREVVNCGALTEDQLHRWIERSLPELENKQSATVELFALVVVFSLAHCGWNLPEIVSEPVIKLCAQHKQQPNCLKLFNLLRRHC